MLLPCKSMLPEKAIETIQAEDDGSAVRVIARWIDRYGKIDPGEGCSDAHPSDRASKHLEGARVSCPPSVLNGRVVILARA